MSHIPEVKYFKYDEKMSLGNKRNIMHEKSRGDILVYMDDDDYYPAERVSHAVKKLLSRQNVLCAGSSLMHIYFNEQNKIYSFGPYGPNHATAGTFAFKRELLNQTSYDSSACLAEEKHFLKNYTIPFIQLDSLKTILVFSHDQNTFDKRTLLHSKNPMVKETNKKVDMIIKDETVHNFYINRLKTLNDDYEIGNPKYKPDVLKQQEEIARKRQKQQQQQQEQQPFITFTDNNGKLHSATSEQVAILLNNQQSHINSLTNILKSRDQEIAELKARLVE